MLQILLHSSKTMTGTAGQHSPLGVPLFIDEADKLAHIWREATTSDIARLMQVSPAKAAHVHELYGAWSKDGGEQVPAIDAFRGDIYSGLQMPTWSSADRIYAHEHLMILSGLYGVLRACDGIRPYRLEMGYKLPGGKTMYHFWKDMLVKGLPAGTSHIINLSAVEYTKALLPYWSQAVIAPKFLTISPKTGAPTFVTVHAKIARGAFARWLIKRRIDDDNRLAAFNDLGYRYNEELSTPEQPVFVCETFQGIGLSVRKQ